MAQQCTEHTNDYQNVNTKFNEFKEKYKLLHCDYELLKEDYLLVLYSTSLSSSLLTWLNQFPETYRKLKKKPYLHLKRPPSGRPSRRNARNPWISNLLNRTSTLGHYWRTAKIYLRKSHKCTKTRSSIAVRCATLFLRVTRITEQRRLCASHVNFFPKIWLISVRSTPSSRPSQSNRTYYPVAHSYSHHRSRIVRYRSDPTLDQVCLMS